MEPDEMMPDAELDCVGYYCPVPIGMTKEELLIKCGEPLVERKANNMEVLLFHINFDAHYKYVPNEWEMSGFAVTVSNGCVISWMPSGKKTVVQ